MSVDEIPRVNDFLGRVVGKENTRGYTEGVSRRGILSGDIRERIVDR